MNTVEYRTIQGETRTAHNVTRIDADMFAGKSSTRKRKSDLMIHIDNIITDVSHMTYEEETAEDQTHGGMSQDEFDGLTQAGELGLEFPEATELVNRKTIKERLHSGEHVYFNNEEHQIYIGEDDIREADVWYVNEKGMRSWQNGYYIFFNGEMIHYSKTFKSLEKRLNKLIEDWTLTEGQLV